MTGAVVVQAPAKLNVFLRVLGRREDGLHDIETLILPLDLVDTVTTEPAETLTVEVVGGPRELVSGPDNLALVAARLLAARVGLGRAGAHIRIVKRIPVAAGMGGGSADAAATLRALNELWSCGLDPAALAGIASQVGSDVPALLSGDAVFATGRGERVFPVQAATTCWVARPFGVAVRSHDAYEWWDEDPSTGPDPGALVAALETGNIELLGSALFNDLQPVVARRHRQIVAAIEAFEAAGAPRAIMTGSGPTVVALARHLGHAAALSDAVPGSFVVGGPPDEIIMGEQSGVV